MIAERIRVISFLLEQIHACGIISIDIIPAHIGFCGSAESRAHQSAGGSVCGAHGIIKKAQEHERAFLKGCIPLGMDRSISIGKSAVKLSGADVHIQ